MTDDRKADKCESVSPSGLRCMYDAVPPHSVHAQLTGREVEDTPMGPSVEVEEWVSTNDPNSPIAEVRRD